MPQHSFRNVNGPKRKLVVGSSAISLAVILWLWPPAARSVNMLPAALAPAGLHGPYSTNFPRAESPISEGGKWYNGQTNGLDWANVRTSPGFAFGTEIGGSRPEPQKYDDSTALLEGTWGRAKRSRAWFARRIRTRTVRSGRKWSCDCEVPFLPTIARGTKSCSDAPKLPRPIAISPGGKGRWESSPT